MPYEHGLLLWQEAGGAGAADVDFGLALAGVAEQFDELIHAELGEGDVVDADNLIAGREAGLLGGRAGRGLEDDDAAGQDADDGAEALRQAAFHLLELLELVAIEEDGVRIEHAQHAGDGAGIEGAIGVDWIGGVFKDGGVDVEEAAEFAFQLGGVGQRARGGLGAERRGGEE